MRKNNPLIIAHRGACASAPENTLAAFRFALDSGADGVEFDVQLSNDSVPVVMHDLRLKRTGARAERVADLTAEQLAQVDVGSWFNRKNPRRAQPEFSQETVPTLEQVLNLLKEFDGLIYIELKCDELSYRPLVAAVCDLIRDSPLVPQVIIKSFKLAAIPEVLFAMPDIQTAALFDPSILNFLRGRKHIIALAREFGAKQISLHRALITSNLTRRAKEANLPVTVWTVDDQKWLHRARKLEITALITNDPLKLLGLRDN